MDKEVAKAYWKENISTILKLLVVWFIVSFGCGIIFVHQLDKFTIGGFKVGFWFAQQASIYVFVILIFVYAFLMEKIEKKYNVNE